MSLLIASTDPAALRSRLRRPGAPRHVLIYGGEEVPEFPERCSVRRPVERSTEERLQIQDAYVELISDLGALNRFSVAWLSHPISEKNDLTPNPLFEQILAFLEFRHHWDAVGAGNGLAVLARHKSLLANILAFARASGIPCETPGSPIKPSTPLREMKRWFRRARTELGYSKKIRTWSLRARPYLKRLDRHEPVTLIRTWFDLRSRKEIEAGRDVFLGPLPGYLKRRGRRVLYYGGVTNIDSEFDTIESDLRRVRAFPVLPEVALLSSFDRWAIALRALLLHRRIRLAPVNSVAGVDVTVVLRNYLTKRYALEGLRKNQISLLALRRLFKTFDVEEIYMPFENNSWQKLLSRTARERKPPIPTRAFQHAQVALNSTRLFLGRKEAEAAPMPDRIFTLGAYTRDFLVNRKRYPAERTIPACALRQDRLPSTNGHRSGRRQLLACLWTRRRSAELLRFLTAARLSEAEWSVCVRPHPVQPLERIQKRLDGPLPSAFHVSSSTLLDDLEHSDVVLYSGTTACLDALAVGLPVVNVEFDDFITPDPLFDFDTFKWTVRSPAELAGVLREIAALPDGEFMRRREAGKRFVSEYFYPVNDRSLEKIAGNGAISQSSPKTSSSNSGS